MENLENLKAYLESFLPPHFTEELQRCLSHVRQHANITNTLLVFLTILLVTQVVKKLFRNVGKRLPPGPMGLPVVGYLPFLTRMPHLKMQQMQKKYGNVFGFYMGSLYTVVLSDFDSIKEGLCKEEALARPETNAFKAVGGSPSIGDIHGVVWKEQRRFALHTLRDLGFGKSRMEAHIKEEISQLIHEISKSAGQPCDVNRLLTPSMSNNISSLVFGRRFDYNDPDRIHLDHILARVAKNIGQTALQQFFPWLLKMTSYFRFGSLKELYEALLEMKTFVRNQIKGHRSSLQDNDIRDYIDAYLVEMDKHKDEPDTHFTETMLENNVGAFFGAGSGTVRTTIDWALIIVASYPKIQERIHKEIDEVNGTSKTPSWSDQAQMPYTNATLLEVYRWKPIVPINPLRRALKDTKIQGYDIPEGTTLLANLWSCHHDPKYWKNPEIFDPERFISEDGTLLNREQLIPFSIGKRSCPGETLARSEVFLYFVSILHKFQVDLADDKDLLHKETLGISLQPKPYKLIFRPRH